MPRSNARLLCTFSFRPFSVVFNGFLECFYPSSAIDDDDRRQKRDAIQKCSDFPAQGYVDSNGYVLGKLEKSVGTIDFSKNRPTDGSSQNRQQVAHEGEKRGRRKLVFETLNVRNEGAVLFVEISAPPMNLNGPELVRDLVSLIQQAEADEAVQVLVFKSADPDYFISHVDVTRIKENRAEAAKLNGDPSIGQLYRHLSASRLVSIAQIEGRVRGVGSEFVLACDMRFAARESAIFSQFEPSFGVIPGAGGAQHLARLMGRGRALEVMLSAQDYDADLAERYGWINRALPAAELDDFVRSLAHRIAKFPAAGHAVVKERVNALTLPTVEDIRRDSDLFLEGTRTAEFQVLTQAAMKRGFQTREAEMDLAKLVSEMQSKTDE